MSDEKKRVPKLRFPEFTEDWEQRKLGEFGKATGGTSIESEFDELGKYKVISIGSYSETSKYTDQGIRANKTNKTENRILNKNDLTMILNDKTASGNIIGRVLLIDADDSYVFNQRTERIEVYENEYLPEFLYQLLNADNVREKIIRASQGNTQIYVNWTSISELSYEIPVSKNEQRKIAVLFNQLDHLITLHQHRLKHWEEMKKGLLQKMFPKKGETCPQIRFPSFNDDWEQRKLGDIGSVSMCRRIFKDQTSETGDIPFYKIGTFGGEPDAFISTELFEEYKAKYPYPKKGDILISASGSIGRTVEFTGEKEYFQDSNIVWLNHGEQLDNTFLKCFYNVVKWSGLEGSTIKRLYNDNILKTEISVPSIEEQRRVGSYFTHLDNLITLHQRKLKHLQKLKKGLLQQMFI